jgi:hypothetical protein
VILNCFEHTKFQSANLFFKMDLRKKFKAPYGFIFNNRCPVWSLLNTHFKNEFRFVFDVGGLVPRECSCRYFIRGETEAGWVAWMLGGPVPTTKLHRCAEGGEIEGWRTPSNEPTHHERRTILAECRHRSNTDTSSLLRFAIPCLWSWNVSYEFLKYLPVQNVSIYMCSYTKDLFFYNELFSYILGFAEILL